MHYHKDHANPAILRVMPYGNDDQCILSEYAARERGLLWVKFYLLLESVEWNGRW